MIRTIALTKAALLAMFACVAAADAPALAGKDAPRLRVCADPNNMPFSNAREEGLENALARLLAKELGASLEYVWVPQRRGFVRNTLRAGRCDVILALPFGSELTATTQPYYRSTYVFVYRQDRGLAVRSLDDAALRTLRIGVQTIGDDYANSPPVDALAARGLVSRVVGYSVFGDYSQEAPLAPIVNAVINGDIDLAIVWGPVAGWLAQRAPVPLKLVPVSPTVDRGFLPFSFPMAMGVRRHDTALLARLNRTISDHRTEIDDILRRYGVPLVPDTEAERLRRSDLHL